MTKASRRRGSPTKARKRNGSSSPKTLELLQLMQGMSSLGFLLAIASPAENRVRRSR